VIEKFARTLAVDSARRMSRLALRAFVPTTTNSSQIQSMRYTDKSTFDWVEKAGTVVSCIDG
jgi:hypothetical protein